MPINALLANRTAMPIGARRVFRLSITIALSLLIAYGSAVPLPYLTPIFALILGLKPAPPIGFKALFGLVIVVAITTGVGLLLIPMLQYYPVTAILIVAVGLYFSNYLALIAGKALVGTFLIVGFTLISAAGTVSFQLATTVIHSLIIAIVISIVCQWCVYPWFPEDVVEKDGAAPAPDEVPANNTESNWIAIRSTLIILPAYYVALTNPAAYLAIIMKAVSLSQQGSVVSAKDAGKELLGSTFLGGCIAIAFWFMLDLVTSLWMYAGWMAIFAVFCTSRMYGIFKSRFPLSFWQNAFVTMIILLGPAVEDSASGKDVYQAFAVRMSLFVGVTLYAWAAVYGLEHLRERRQYRKKKGMASALN